MLIRSQDRTKLLNVEKVGLISVHDGDGEWIVALTSNTDEVWDVEIIGTYSTKAKALKVLDDIEDMYIQEAKHTTSCVLYMPLDDEVEVNDEVKEETKDV